MLWLRANAIVDLNNAVYKALNRLLKSTCTRSRSNDQCHAMILGSYTSFLFKHKYLPRREGVKHAAYSLRHLALILSSVKIRALDEDNYMDMANYVLHVGDAHYSWERSDFFGNGLHSHSKCANVFDLPQQVEKIMSSIPSPTLDSHRLHMEEQAKK
ncbi:hypothetical protein BU25DRAFT_275044 [Macroventuria anomochaeta]|uniref:Uncharacterized protein n=1 Tax=Macroventuria anomochaeta TaxID=301207 RepID=A0ACB6S9C7_9PLEO|nr:uncharacterized protein BU25DRAFT_275044 [Macroventuria anomochaeta]KAF2629829.1 hypothetical protein BU25DRAFT_275044 [Macroventuria anomochaeta]